MDIHFHLLSFPVQIGFSTDGSKLCLLEASGMLHIYDDVDSLLEDYRKFLVRYLKNK